MGRDDDFVTPWCNRQVSYRLLTAGRDDTHTDGIDNTRGLPRGYSRRDMATTKGMDVPAPAAPVPMLATLGTAPRGDAWAVEQKWDGQRGLAVIDGHATLYSRNGMDIKRTFPEVGAGPPLWADVAPWSWTVNWWRWMWVGGRFQRLQRRWPQSRRPSASLTEEASGALFRVRPPSAKRRGRAP